MASVFRRKQKSGKKTHRSPTWHIDYSGLDGNRNRVAGFTDKSATERMARDIERLVACRKSGAPLPADLESSIDRWPERIQRHLLKAGLLDAAQRAEAIRLDEHLKQWREALDTKGDSTKHAGERYMQADTVLKVAGAVFWNGITANSVDAALNELTERRNWSVRTKNAYLSSIKGFTRWMHRTGRAPIDPLRVLSQTSTNGRQVHERRALTADECDRLIQATENSGRTVQGLSPRERGLFYKMALTTGLRLGELKTLERRHIDFTTEPATVTIEASNSKSRRADTLPLHDGLVGQLAEHIGDRAPDERVFNLIQYPRGSKMLQTDLAEAGIDYRDANGKVADFHSLRVTFISALARASVHPSVAQELARHSDIKLTLQTYTKVDVTQKAEGIAKLPMIGSK